MKKKFFLPLLMIFAASISSSQSSSRCLGSYTKSYDENKNWGLQIFTKNLDILNDQLLKIKNLGMDEASDQLLLSEARVLFFRMEDQARVYNLAYQEDKSSFFLNYLNLFKKFEGLLGQVDLKTSLLQLSKDLKEPELVSHFRDLKQKSEGDFFSALEEELSLKKIRKNLVDFPKWKSAKKDKKIHISYLAKELERLSKDIKKRKFTHSDIEKGLHELRRRIRWIVIHVQNLNGFTQYDHSLTVSTKVDSFLNELIKANPLLTESKYLKMTPSEVSNPLAISFKVHSILCEIVSTIGTAKDNAEKQIYIHEALEELGYSKSAKMNTDMKLKALLKVNENVDHQKLADYYQERIESTELLEEYIRTLKKLN